MRRTGCSYRLLTEAIDSEGKALDGKPGRPRRDYPDLGQVSDGELARRLGLTQSTVSRARRRRGLPPYTPRVPDGVPETGAALREYRTAAGLSFRQMAAALLRDDGSTYTHQGISIAEKREARPLSGALAATILTAIRAGRLPSPPD